MAKRGRWFLLSLLAMGLLVALYTTQGAIRRAYIAVSISRAHVFTPPDFRNASRWKRFRESAQFYWDFAGIPAARARRLKMFEPELKPLLKEISRRESSGEDMSYSMHIYREVRWLLNFTPDTEETAHQIGALRDSLSDPIRQKAGNEQQPDGSWAYGITTWYLKLYYSTDQIETCHGTPRYPLRFLDRVGTPEMLRGQLNAALEDDFTRTGVFQRERLDETFSALARILLKKKLTDCYAFDPGLPDALRTFVDDWQNPQTGCWGPWLIDRHGGVWKMDDMGMTFHVISDTHGEVRHLDRIARRLLQLDDVNFPAGIRFNGHRENHLDADAVVILRYAWPQLDESTRSQARQTISQMLDWTLSDSLQPDGSFKVSELDDTRGDAYEYGVWFLDETGYCNRRKRFWTGQDFPQSSAVCERIAASLRATGLNDPHLKEAYETLQAGK